MDFRVDDHFRKREGSACQLKIHLVNMIEVDMGIAEGMNEFPRFQSGDLGHHHRQYGIGSDVERNTQEDIAAPLVHLA